ncbi:MAG: class I SAM-dependent methyltransferase, partial [Myxococcota bacterium]
MSFSADWLTLREPFDHRARSAALAEGLAASLDAVPVPWRILELGAGTGSGARWLTDRLGAPLSVWALDHDRALLERVPADLATPLHADVRDFGAWPDPLHAVTLQALLDLVDLGFLQQLADALATRRLPVLAALTVDGRVAWDPVHPDDEAVQ